MTTKGHARAKSAEKAGWRWIDTAIPWLLLLFFLFLPVAVVFDRTVALGAGVTLLGLLIQLSKRAR